MISPRGSLAIRRMTAYWGVLGAAALAVFAGQVLPLAVLPTELGLALNLSVFTGSTAPVPFGADAAWVGLPAAGLAALAGIALAIERRAARPSGVATQMRVGG